MNELVPTEFKRPSDLPRTCSDDDLLEAVQLWLCGAGEDEIASLLNVTPGVFKREWLTAKGWRFLESCVKDDVRAVAHANLTRIAHRCFGLINERLERGDPIYGLEGEIVGYRAVKVKDLGNLATQMLTQGQEIDKRMAGKDPVRDMSLEELAASLKNYVAHKRFTDAKDVTDATTGQNGNSTALN